MSKKRTYDVLHIDDNSLPPRKRIRLDKPLRKMTVSELKKEIKKRDKNQKISKLKKDALKSTLFKQIQLSESEIDKLNRTEIVNELKMHNAYQNTVRNVLDPKNIDRSSWNRNDLADYLKYINSTPNVLHKGYIDDFGVDNTKHITKHEMMQMPLYKIQQIYGPPTHATKRDKLYEGLLGLWECQKMTKKDKQRYIKHFFIENNGIFSIKPEIMQIKVENDKVLKFRDLDEFMKMRLYEIQSMHSKTLKRLNEYNLLQRQRELQQEQDKYIKILQNHFFTAASNGTLSIKQEMKETDKVLAFHNCCERSAIHQFAEKNGLFSLSVGPKSHRIIGIGRNCDRSNVFDVLHAEETKYRDKLRQQQLESAKCAEMARKQKHLLLKEEQKNNNRWNICGEWAMTDGDFGYGNENRHYLYINQSDRNMYGSFLIGPIEGKFQLKTNGMIRNFNKKFRFEWRGRETGEGEIQIGGRKSGEITFAEFGTVAVGVLNSDYGDFEFHALKISDDVRINASKFDFEFSEEERHETERVGRWR